MNQELFDSQRVLALSLTQPWATLMVLGVKRIETRSWNTYNRGRVLIHAAKGARLGDRRFAEWFWREWSADVDPLRWDDLPRGAIVGSVDFYQTRPTERLRESSDLSPRERVLGNYELGRFAFLSRQPRQHPNPVPCRGALMFWTVPPEIVAQCGGLL